MAFRGMVLIGGFVNAPTGFVRCDGQLLPIATFSDLFAILGTAFGGDGSTTFGVPNLVGGTINGAGSGSGLPSYALFDINGELEHTLILSEVPTHTHGFKATTVTGTLTSPNGNILGGAAIYDATSDGSNMRTALMEVTGAGQSHENRQPFLPVSYFIATDDVDPDENTGELRIYPDVAPTGWLICDGSAVSRSTFSDLFAVIGVTYGIGDGSTTFNLPDLSGRIPIHVGQSNVTTNNYTLGQLVGEASVTLDITEVPLHTHIIDSYSPRALGGQVTSPVGHEFALVGSGTPYAPPTSALNSTMGSDAVRTAGSSADHNNCMPMVAFNYIIKT